MFAPYASVLAGCPLPAWIEVIRDPVTRVRELAYANEAAARLLGQLPTSGLPLAARVDVVTGESTWLQFPGRRVPARYCALDSEQRVWAVWVLEEERHADGPFRQMLELQEELVLRCDTDGQVTYLNNASRKHFALALNSSSYPSLRTLLTAEQWTAWQEVVARLGAVRSARSRRLELMTVAQDAVAKVTDFCLYGIFDAEGLLVEVMAVGHDVTQSKEKQRALGDALGEVEKLTRELESERSYLREEIGAMVESGAAIGQSPPMRALLEQVMSVARTDSTVLILGETGTGKEVIARTLHQASERAQQALVKVNCAALPASLVESELFGHERGAFTGAVSRRHGRFEVADRGTIFLDEVGEIPLDTQAKLLRVLQEHEFERVGSNKAIRVNVRVVAATNRDLSVEVQKGRFRADLYYRLAVFPLRIPALRERVSDIPILAEHFVQRFARERNRKHCRGFTPDAMRWLSEYHWPGNVRELQSVIERALILLRGDFIDLPLLQVGGAAMPSTSIVRSTDTHAPDREPLVTLEEMERRYIERALRECGARIEGEDGAAAILDLPPSTLRSRMRKLGIRR